MRIPIFLSAALLAAAPAHAGVPLFAADCTPGLQVRAEAKGAVRINGRPVRLIARPDGQTTALAGGIDIDITPQGSAPPRVTYTARDKSTGTCDVVASGAPDAAAAPRALAGTRWRLVEFQSMDDRQATTRPHDASLYTMQLGADGRVQMQLNCNRAQGDWSAEPAADRTSGRFSFGPLAATRALCPPPSMDETIVAQAPYVRGYLLKDGRLHLSLMADGGIFVWEPDPTAAAPAAMGPAEGGPRAWRLAGTGGAAALREAPSLQARIVARPAAGAILSNLGCQAADAQTWCDVQPLRGGPRGYLPASSLAPATAPDGTVPAGEDDSALRAGQGRFDASGSLPCAQYKRQPLGNCAYGVAHAGGGYATVVVTRPDGRTRAIYFGLGQPLGADTSQADGMPAFTAAREGGLYRIRIGSERYEIAQEVVLGR
jgi:heat shock protein HslJ